MLAVLILGQTQLAAHECSWPIAARHERQKSVRSGHSQRIKRLFRRVVVLQPTPLLTFDYQLSALLSLAATRDSAAMVCQGGY